MVAIETATAPLQYLCPKHQTKLLYVLRGGAGFCRECGLYTQALGIPEPTLPKRAKNAPEASESSQADGRAALKKRARSQIRANGARCTINREAIK